MRALTLAALVAGVWGIGPQLAAARIRTVRPSEIPELPRTIADKLEQRGCRIPQAKRHRQDNVIRGEFLEPGSFAWAILCATKENTTLLVIGDDGGQLTVNVRTSGNTFHGWTISLLDRSSDSMEQLWRGWPDFQKSGRQGIISSTEWGNPEDGPFRYSAESDILYYDGKEWVQQPYLISN